MLGKKVEINFDPNQKSIRNSKGHLVFKGTSRLKNNKENFTAYYIGYKCPNNLFLGKVSAVLEYSDSKIVIITAYNLICYEPEIIESVLKMGGKHPINVSCLYEKSCGAVVYKWQGSCLLFLLVKNKHSWHWAFPKGHIEKNETERQTAEREVFEETGLRVKALEGFRQTCEYRPFGRTKKHVVLFVAKSLTKNVKIQKEEIDKYTWVSFNIAYKMFKYENDKNVLIKARNWILRSEKNKPSNRAVSRPNRSRINRQHKDIGNR